jgi:predicted phosphate transport protein (TIGR00153 family)
VPPSEEIAVGLRLTPRDEGFFGLFGRSAAYVVAATDELSAILGAVDGPERKAIAKRIGELENSADEATHEIIRRAQTSFVTPFDRGDVHRLAGALDDCIDHMEAAADHIRLHAIDEIPPRMGRQVDVLARMAALTLDAMPRLRNLPELAEYWIEINRLENQAGKNYRKLVAELFEAHANDPIGLQRYLLVVGELEATADAFEKVAHIIESIAVKEA